MGKRESELRHQMLQSVCVAVGHREKEKEREKAKEIKTKSEGKKEVEPQYKPVSWGSCSQAAEESRNSPKTMQCITRRKALQHVKISAWEASD